MQTQRRAVRVLGFLLSIALVSASLATAPDVAAGADDTRYGLTLEQRKQVFRELGNALVRARHESAAKYKDNPEGMGRLRYQDQLADTYKAEIAKQRGITLRQLVLISAEGFQDGWPIEE